MSKNKQPQVPKKNEVPIVRSSAAEYLTFVAAGGNGGVEAVYADENVWLAQSKTLDPCSASTARVEQRRSAPPEVADAYNLLCIGT